jgi:hypothetical protein
LSAFDDITIFGFGYSDRCIVILHCGFHLLVPGANDVGNIFTSLFAMCISSLMKTLSIPFPSFELDCLYFFFFEFLGFFIPVLCWMYGLQTLFFHPVGFF